MAKKKHDFESLMERVRRKSQGAAREVLQRYGRYILQVIRRRLSHPLRSRYDSTDFMQSVWASFFALPPRRHRFNGPKDLLAYLAAIARNKVISEYRMHRMAQKECAIEGRPPVFLENQPDPRGSTPSQAAVAKEERNRLIAELPEPYRRVLDLHRAGSTNRAIARLMGHDEKTIARVLFLLTKRVTA